MDDLSANTRTYGGNSKSYNGWPFITHNGTVAATVPGTKAVNIPIRKGDVATILNAWAALWNKRIRPIEDDSAPDYGGWTSTNSHPTSCHLSGTAIDLNWNAFPFRVRRATPAQRAAADQMVKDFRGVVAWGGHWSDPVDEMHAEIAVLPGDPRIATLVRDLEAGYLGVYATDPNTTGDKSMTTQYDVDRPNSDPAKRPKLDLTAAVFRTLFEATYWIKRRSLQALQAKGDRPDTVLGHAADAASYAVINHQLLVRIADKLDVDTTGLA
jgi:hypothetical protein